MNEQEIKSKRSKSARRRGKRAEYMLRDHLRRLGWQAERVPTSGAARGFKGDVKATKGDRTLLFECKNYTGTFASIWTLYDAAVKAAQDDVMSVAIPGAECLCVDISTSLEAVFQSDGVYTLIARHPQYAEHKRTFDRFPTLEKLVGESDILVLKDNNKPWLFIRFR